MDDRADRAMIPGAVVIGLMEQDKAGTEKKTQDKTNKKNRDCAFHSRIPPSAWHVSQIPKNTVRVGSIRNP